MHSTDMKLRGGAAVLSAFISLAALTPAAQAQTVTSQTTTTGTAESGAGATRTMTATTPGGNQATGTVGMTATTSTGATTNPALDQSVGATLAQCQQVSASCAAMTKDAAGILIFPEVLKADLIIGGAGGKGALIENGQVTGYYNIGAVSAGLQAGVEKTSHVYVFRSAAALAELKRGPDWKVGATAGVTLVDANANAGVTTSVLAYIFDGKGLHGGISLDVFRVWRAGQERPNS